MEERDEIWKAIHSAQTKKNTIRENIIKRNEKK